jgi:hypothetical protein
MKNTMNDLLWSALCRMSVVVMITTFCVGLPSMSLSFALNPPLSPLQFHIISRSPMLL